MSNEEVLLDILDKFDDEDDRCECGCLLMTNHYEVDGKEYTVKYCSNPECKRNSSKNIKEKDSHGNNV